MIICDEVTSALDTVVGAAILDLLAELRRTLGVAIMFISHDLYTVRAIADEVMIMYAGRPVETGPRRGGRPAHPYTDLLLRSVPELRPGWLDGLPAAPGAGTPAAARRATTCAFFSRCELRSSPAAATPSPAAVAPPRRAAPPFAVGAAKRSSLGPAQSAAPASDSLKEPP